MLPKNHNAKWEAAVVNPPVPKLVRLEPPGPHRTLIAVALLSLSLDQGRLPVHIQFALQDGEELQIPVTDEVLNKLRARLNELGEIPTSNQQ